MCSSAGRNELESLITAWFICVATCGNRGCNCTAPMPASPSSGRLIHGNVVCGFQSIRMAKKASPEAAIAPHCNTRRACGIAPPRNHGVAAAVKEMASRLSNRSDAPNRSPRLPEPLSGCVNDWLLNMTQSVAEFNHQIRSGASVRNIFCQTRQLKSGRGIPERLNGFWIANFVDDLTQFVFKRTKSVHHIIHPVAE